MGSRITSRYFYTASDRKVHHEAPVDPVSSRDCIHPAKICRKLLLYFIHVRARARERERGERCVRLYGRASVCVCTNAGACWCEGIKQPRSPFSRVKLITGDAIIYFHFPHGESLPSNVGKLARSCRPPILSLSLSLSLVPKPFLHPPTVTGPLMRATDCLHEPRDTIIGPNYRHLTLRFLCLK